jgi:hypothetical protein
VTLRKRLIELLSEAGETVKHSVIAQETVREVNHAKEKFHPAS